MDILNFRWDSVFLPPGYEILFYTILLLSVWIFVRFIATSCINSAFNFFREPVLKVIPYLNGVIYPVSYWTEKGKRPYQEDRYHIMKATTKSGTILSLYGVFDGHGGYRASQYCKEVLLSSISSNPDWDKSPSAAISSAFFKVDAEFSSRAKTQMLNDGSTAVVAVFDEKTVFVGNAGDSRAIIVQKGGKVFPMSNDHRPERKDEENRIRKLGGKLVHWGRWRVEGVLAVSRAIGDVELQPFITCEPEVTEKVLEASDEYLVIASDGLWDVIENEDVAKIVLRNCKDFLSIAEVLCREAMIMGSGDNITVLVVDLKKRSITKSSGDEAKKLH